MGFPVPSNGKMVDSDLLLLDRQVKEGDAVSGWRGDPDMWVEVYDGDGLPVVWVMGLDAQRAKYGAASTKARPGWRHKLLEKLVLGDWQGRAGDPVARIDAANAAREKERRDRFNDHFVEHVAPKLHWALVKDGAAQRSDFYFPSKEVSRVSHSSKR